MVQAGLAKSNGEARRLVKQARCVLMKSGSLTSGHGYRPQEGMVGRSGKRGFAKMYRIAEEDLLANHE